jgi:hypothetical protein
MCYLWIIFARNAIKALLLFVSQTAIIACTTQAMAGAHFHLTHILPRWGNVKKLRKLELLAP